MRFGRLTVALTFVALGVSLAGLSTASPPTAHAQAEPDGLIRVVHGLRGLVADIYLNGTLVLPTFQPERSTEPIAVPAGDHVIEIRTAGAAMTETALLTQTVTVPAGFQGSLVAHLGPTGAPQLSVFADDMTAVPPGTSRLVIRHTAAAQDISVLLNAQAVIPAVAATAEGSEVVSAGPYALEVTALTGGAPLAAPQDVEYPDGTANFMYLIGSESEGTLGWAAVQIADLQTAPERIQTGDGSTRLTAPGGGATGRQIAMTMVAMVAITVAGVVASRSRSRRMAG
jgi:Domain of unknown function (DUF4397)